MTCEASLRVCDSDSSCCFMVPKAFCADLRAREVTAVSAFSRSRSVARLA